MVEPVERGLGAARARWGGGAHAARGSTAPMPEVDHEQEAIDELRAAFTIFDREGKGFVEIREAKSLFYTLGIKIRKKTIREMIEKDGKDGQNSLDFNEFSGLAIPLFKKRVLVDDDADVFRLLDIESKDKVTLENLKQVCEEIGESIPDDELNEIIDEASRYRDDGIRMADYLRVVRRKRDDDE